MSDLRFASPEHRDFFLEMISEARRNRRDDTFENGGMNYG